MRALALLSFNVFISSLNCANFDSYEINQLEITPIYDIILFNDISDVIKDLDNDLNSQTEAQSFTESESNENMEDLLMEYQHYLDKAHKQRLDYLEKLSAKNKVPLLRHERYPKMKPGFYRNNPQKMFSNLAPFSGFKSNSKFSVTTSRSSLLQNTNVVNSIDTTNNNQLMSYIHRSSSKPGVASCYCKTNEVPCNCGCKHCIMPYDSVNGHLNSIAPEFDSWNVYTDPFLKQLPDKKTDNDFKIRIKVDVKLPKILEQLARFFSNQVQGLKGDTMLRKESSRNYLLPYYKVPNSELLGLNSIPQLPESFPMQRITIHKKKKFRTNANKKHKKKVVNFHELTLDKNSTAEINTNQTVKSQDKSETLVSKNSITQGNNVTDSIQQKSNNNASIKSLNIDNNNQSKEFIYLTLNIANDNDNHTEEISRLENSIETGYVKTKDNFTTIMTNIRDKREVLVETLNNKTFESPDLSVKPLNETHDKKMDKLLTDPSLLYWSENETPLANSSSKNINSLIFNIEKRKTKFNMTRESIRNNHSIALEKAIFGDVEWSDVDTVAPVFISFVGKYVHGVLTFCSDKICHSMKCVDKTCIHRKCDPAKRYNNIGHCLGSSGTDSTAKMESIMDLPSNLAFEIVDILQDKMLGKMYGKMTICMGLKCVTFVASKKTMLKTKCTSKELTASSECMFNKQH